MTAIGAGEVARALTSISQAEQFKRTRCVFIEPHGLTNVFFCSA